MPLNEPERLQAVDKFMKIDFSLEQELQDIVSTAAKICDCPTALISLIGEETQYIRFKQSFDFTQTARKDAFCNHTIDTSDFFVVEDASKDDRFMNNPLVLGDPNIRFYAGIPLATHDGFNLGSLCVIDKSPKTISGVKLKMLTMLARHAMHLFEFESGISLLKSQYLEAKKTETKLLSFFESSTSEHIMIDKDYTILAFNKRLRDFILQEYHIAIEKGMKVTAFVRENYMAEFLNNCSRALLGERIRHERLIQFKESSHWCDITYDPARNADGEIIGISFNSTDITNRIEEQKKLLLHQNLLAKTAFLQSHELRRPVANMKGILQLLKIENHFNAYPLLLEIENDLEELDEKIKTIVGFTAV
ncbi:PAS domain S-box-containing protein [Pedobacter westerhofensis]|uniref:PAS domain S-box-containing protein n=1 Tax=Pedobacter westerhofensis TaxID=425512 RepID=A0A521FUS5_9SPHI|nr:GAF domain-containing protein [Pedobacter westerhofensis]SMO99917.1 PAS domain S-box-containing protein [Pedobacter westerhofensis]